MKVSEKDVREILEVKTAGLPEEQKKGIENLVSAFANTCNKAVDGLLDKEALDNALEPIIKQVGEYAAAIKDNEELINQVKTLSEAIDKLKSNGVGVDVAAKFADSFNAMYDSPKFRDFMENKEKGAKGYVFKDFSLTNNYTGGQALLTYQSDIVAARSPKKLHIRDFADVFPGDPNYPVFGYQQIYDMDMNARFVAENGQLPSSSFKVKECSAEVARVGHAFKLSKRALKCRAYLQGYVATCLAAGVRDAEDAAILFGDGSGDSLKGITTYDGVNAVETIIGTSAFTVAAGGVDSVAKHDSGVLVTLKAANANFTDGLKVTITGATQNTGLNSTFDIVKVNDEQFLIEKATLADATKLTTDAPLLALTFKSGAYQSIDTPNSVDALETAVAVMTYAQYAPTILALNPITLNSIRTEKATNGNRLDLPRDIDGNPIIAGIKVIPLTCVPVGKYLIGDLSRGAQIIDYTPLTIEWKDDVDTALKNQIVMIAQAEMIVPVYNPWAFSYGSISALKTAITKGA